jgi:hypothetical protein
MRANERNRAWIVVVLLFIFMVINFADKAVIGIAAVPIIKRRIIVAMTTERVLICVADENRCPCSGPFNADRAA